MHELTQEALIQSIRAHPAIIKAALTGSLARRAADQFSDLDALLIASDMNGVSNVKAWLPRSIKPLICAFHLDHYCTVLTDDFQKFDLAIFTENDPPSLWVVHDYQIIKGGTDFESQLAQAAKTTRQERAVHLGADMRMDNVLLLLATALGRQRRGELLSAHAFLAMACDMVIALDTRRHGANGAADLLDPRRRLERLNPPLAATIQQCLFVPPGTGILQLARWLVGSQSGELTEGQLKVLDYVLEPPPAISVGV